jgi:hypothetical protein
MTWTAVAVNGMNAAPYWLLAFLTAGFLLFVLPLRSSFRVLARGRNPKLHTEVSELDELVMGRYETAVHSVAYVVLPAFFKVPPAPPRPARPPRPPRPLTPRGGRWRCTTTTSWHRARTSRTCCSSSRRPSLSSPRPRTAAPSGGSASARTLAG